MDFSDPDSIQRTFGTEDVDVTTNADARSEPDGSGGTIPDRIRSGVDSARSVGGDVQDRLPGRTGEAAALGAGIAAIPEPTPATEVAGGGLAVGATVVGGSILAADAARRSEVGIGDVTPSELDPTRSRRGSSELGISDSSSRTSELEPASAGITGAEVSISDPTGRPEVSIPGGGTATGGETAPGTGDSVVPGEFPTAGRDFPADPSQEFVRDTDPSDLIGSGVDTATGVTIGTGTGETVERDPTGSVGTGTGTGTAGDIMDEVRRDIENPVERGPGGAFRPERAFPTGSSAVVGAETGRLERAIERDIEIGGTGFGTGVGVGPTPRDPIGGGLGDQQPGTEPGIGVGDIAGTGTGTEISTGPGTTTEPLETTLTRERALTGQQQAQAQAQAFGQTVAQQQAMAQPQAFENAFANPTLSELGFGGGGGGSSSRDAPRPGFELEEADSDPTEIVTSFGDARFDSGILGGDQAFEDLFER